jgi:hypothetical protein
MPRVTSLCRRLPTEVQHRVRRFLWGTRYDWQRKLDIVHSLRHQGYLSLRDVASYTSYSNYIEAEDSLYCQRCGEKKLHFALSFHMDACLDCVQQPTLPLVP